MAARNARAAAPWRSNWSLRRELHKQVLSAIASIKHTYVCLTHLIIILLVEEPSRYCEKLRPGNSGYPIKVRRAEKQVEYKIQWKTAES